MGNKSISPPSSEEENKESTTLIWFDPNIGSRQDIENTKQQLRHINDYVKFYTDLEQCVKYIQSISNEKIFLITSDTKASQILPRISSLSQIDSIFIFSMKINRYQHLIDEYSKVIGIYNNLDALYSSLREQIDLVDKQIRTFSFFDQNQKSIKYLPKQSKEFLWFQLFNQVILRLPHNQHAKQQMIDICRQYYRGNIKEQQLIDEFERNYRPEEAIRWYSKQSFVYKLVNKALRNGDIDLLHIFRFFIVDLFESLTREHEKILLSEEEIFTVYRGVKLDKKEFDKLKENQGKLISINGYLSTNRRRSSAFEFAWKPIKRDDVIPVLFEIKCHVKELGKSIIFADISELSEYPDKQELLFDLSTAFQLDSIENDGEIQLIKMSTTQDGEMITKNYIEETQHETEERNVGIVFGRLICYLGEYDKSQKYFERLLNDPNGEDLAWVEYNIGRALHCKGQWNEACKYYDRAYNRMMNAEPARIKDSASALNNIGIILHRQAKYTEALEYYQRALQIREKYYPSGHVHIAASLSNIGGILHDQTRYDEALDYYQRALEIREKHHSSDHIKIADNLNNIGGILHSQGKYDKALDYYQRALKIRENYYLSNHIDIVSSLNNIGIILYNQGKYNEAFDYYQRALEIREKYYSSNYIDIASNLSYLGNIFEKQGKYVEALDYHHQALKMKEKYYPTGNICIAVSLNSIANIQYRQGNYDEALDYYQRALRIQGKYYPSGHIDIGYSLRNIGLCYESQNNSKKALNYFQQALISFEKFLPVEHPNRVKTKRDIRRVTIKR